MNSILYTALTALDTFSTGWQAIANNVANVNTDGFKGSHARYQDAPNGQGVQLGEIRTDTSPGALVPGHGEYVNARSLERAEAAAEVAAAQAAVDARAAELREASNVQIEREFTQAIIHEHAIAAQAVMVTTYDDMMGTVLDIKV